MSAEPSATQTTGAGKPLRVPARRERLIAAVAGVVVIGGLALTAFLARGALRAETPSPQVTARTGVERPVIAQPPPTLPPPTPHPPAPPPTVDPPAVAPPAVARAQIASSPRLTQKSLLDRSARLRKRLGRATPKGEDPDPMATMLLGNAERDARAARSEPELKRVDETLGDIERKYFNR